MQRRSLIRCRVATAWAAVSVAGAFAFQRGGLDVALGPRTRTPAVPLTRRRPGHDAAWERLVAPNERHEGGGSTRRGAPVVSVRAERAGGPEAARPALATTTTTTTPAPGSRNNNAEGRPKPRQRPKGAGRVAQGRRRGGVLSGLLEQPQTPAAGELRKYEDDALLPMVHAIAKAADARKATDVASYFLAPVTDVASFVVVANGRSRPQNDAIAAAVVDDVREFFSREPDHVEGGADGGWTVIDYGDVIVHVMTPLSREYYDLDSIWLKKSAPRVDLDAVLTPEIATQRYVAGTGDDYDDGYDGAPAVGSRDGPPFTPRSPGGGGSGALVADADLIPLDDDDDEDWKDILTEEDTLLIADIQNAIDAEDDDDDDEQEGS